MLIRNTWLAGEPDPPRQLDGHQTKTESDGHTDTWGVTDMLVLLKALIWLHGWIIDIKAITSSVNASRCTHPLLNYRQYFFLPNVRQLKHISSLAPLSHPASLTQTLLILHSDIPPFPTANPPTTTTTTTHPHRHILKFTAQRGLRNNCTSLHIL